ncbi:hypothetical protein BJ166DRAFT_187866 [Pestalotiopsis sp. NC0098]|nr:hypothetical protein BJ166DRAFT_187866 [Pestalotiopsis sp. NC0098]
MLPKPSLSFTIPSTHDHTKLDCRVYHPAGLTKPSATASSSWRRNIVVVAHPYAPLGGCYDDPIVDLVGGTLLHLGFMVATFNFRGASSSSGARTSWTSKPEQADYRSFAAFMVYYAHYLDSPGGTNTGDSLLQPPVMLQAGYSYGAMVTTKIPPLHDILAPFESPPVRSDAADIRLRAQHLAEHYNKISRLAVGPGSPRRTMGMRVGGDEDFSRKSQDVARLNPQDHEDRIRRGVKDLLARTKRVYQTHRRKTDGEADEVLHEVECMAKVEDLQAFRSAYLLVSPPVGYVTNLATMSIPNPFGGWLHRGGRSGHGSNDDAGVHTGTEGDASEMKLVQNPTLAIYGDQDSFVMLRKMREWTTRLQRCTTASSANSFCAVEVHGAGHFWVEEGTIYKLRDAVGAFGTELA